MSEATEEAELPRLTAAMLAEAIESVDEILAGAPPLRRGDRLVLVSDRISVLAGSPPLGNREDLSMTVLLAGEAPGYLEATTVVFTPLDHPNAPVRFGRLNRLGQLRVVEPEANEYVARVRLPFWLDEVLLESRSGSTDWSTESALAWVCGDRVPDTVPEVVFREVTAPRHFRSADGTVEITIEAGGTDGRLQVRFAGSSGVESLDGTLVPFRIVGEGQQILPAPATAILKWNPREGRCTALEHLGQLSMSRLLIDLPTTLPTPSPPARLRPPQRRQLRPDNLDALIGLAGDCSEDPILRVEAISALGEAKEIRARQAIVASLRDSSPDVRLSAVVALEKRGERDNVDALRPLISDPAARVREAVAHAFGQLGGLKSQVITLLRDPDASVRQAAAGALMILSSAT